MMINKVTSAAFLICFTYNMWLIDTLFIQGFYYINQQFLLNWTEPGMSLTVNILQRGSVEHKMEFHINFVRNTIYKFNCSWNTNLQTAQCQYFLLGW